MAERTLPVLTHPNFPQVLEAVMASEVRRVDRILSIPTEPKLPACSHESPETYSGACDGGYGCHKPATVHELETGLDWCAQHFAEIQSAQAEPFLEWVRR